MKLIINVATQKVNMARIPKTLIRPTALISLSTERTGIATFGTGISKSTPDRSNLKTDPVHRLQRELKTGISDIFTEG